MAIVWQKLRNVKLTQATAVIFGLNAAIFLGFFIMNLARGNACAANANLGPGGLDFEFNVCAQERTLEEDKFKGIDDENFFKDEVYGYVLHRPFNDDWVYEELSFRQLIQERGAAEIIDEASLRQLERNVAVRRIKTGASQTLQYTESTILGDLQIDPSFISRESAYDQIIVQIWPKSFLASDTPPVRTLLQFFLATTATIGFLGPTELTVAPDNSLFVLDTSALAKNVILDGKEGTHRLVQSFLATENEDFFFLVSINYLETGNKSAEIYRQLQGYLKSFKVVKAT